MVYYFNYMNAESSFYLKANQYFSTLLPFLITLPLLSGAATSKIKDVSIKVRTND